MAIQIQFRRGLASLWTSTNPILAEGELGLELDTHKQKIGDGIHHWNDLAYAGINASPTTPPQAGGVLFTDAVNNITSADPGNAGQLLMSYGDISNGGPQFVQYNVHEPVSVATNQVYFPDVTYDNGVEGVTPATLTVHGTWIPIDGDYVDVGERILVKDQPDPTQNGIYVVESISTGMSGSTVLMRDNDADTRSKLSASLIQVFRGGSNGGTVWVCTLSDESTWGSSPINFVSSMTAPNYGNPGQLLMSYGTAGINGGPQWVSFQLKEQATVATTKPLEGSFTRVTVNPNHELISWPSSTSNIQEVTYPDQIALAADGPLIVDGYQLQVDDRILVKDQTIWTTPSYAANGVYIITDDGVMSNTVGYVTMFRDNDVDTTQKVASMIIPVALGEINGGTIWSSAFKADQSLGVDPITFNTVSNSRQPQLEQIIPIDNIEKYFDGIENRFKLTYQGEPIEITNQFRLLITLNGVTQPIGTPDFVYQTVFGYEYCFIDSDGYLAFPDPIPAGSQFNGRYMAGPDISTVTTYYPFDAMDIMVGAGA